MAIGDKAQGTVIYPIGKLFASKHNPGENRANIKFKVNGADAEIWLTEGTEEYQIAKMLKKNSPISLVVRKFDPNTGEPVYGLDTENVPPPQKEQQQSEPQQSSPPSQQTPRRGTEYVGLEASHLVLAERMVRDAGMVYAICLREARKLFPDNDALAKDVATHFSINIERNLYRYSHAGDNELVPHNMRPVLMPEALRSALNKKADSLREVGKDEGARRKMMAGLTSLFDNDSDRHAFLGAVFGVPSSKELSWGEIHALVSWLDTVPDDGWAISPVVRVEGLLAIGKI